MIHILIADVPIHQPPTSIRWRYNGRCLTATIRNACPCIDEDTFDGMRDVGYWVAYGRDEDTVTVRVGCDPHEACEVSRVVGKLVR